MNPPQRLRTLTGTVTAHVTPLEEEQMKQRAAALGLTRSEWCRQALLQALDVTSDTRILLSELSALRALVLALQLEGLRGNQLSDEQLKQLIEQSEREKFAMADKRIHKYRSQMDVSANNDNSGEAA